MGTGNRFHIVELSTDYGERRFAIDDLALTRDSLVRHWRQRGKGAVTAHGIKPPRTGLIWRGTRAQAEELCTQLNKAAKLGNLTVASDPPTQHNAVEAAKARNRASSRARSASKNAARTVSTANLFQKCDHCKRMVKDGHQCP